MFAYVSFLSRKEAQDLLKIGMSLSGGHCGEARSSCKVGDLMSKSRLNVLMVFVTVANRREAEKIGKAVVKKELAACVNIIPTISSVFRWRGEIQKSQETLLVLKTTKVRYRDLERLIRSKHSYEVPEVLAVAVDRGLKQYLDWITRETTRN